MTNCSKCENTVNGPFCSVCGHASNPVRIDKAYVVNEVRSVLNVERGILFTVKELILRPGENIRLFLYEDRSRLVKPLIFLVVCSLIYTVLMQIFDVKVDFIPASEVGGKDSAIWPMITWVLNNLGYSNIILSFFIAPWLALFFRQQDINFFELLVLLCFVMGVGMLIFTCFGLLNVVISANLDGLSSIVGFIYCAWAIGQFFVGNRYVNFLKALISYIFGSLLFWVFILILGAILDWF